MNRVTGSLESSSPSSSPSDPAPSTSIWGRLVSESPKISHIDLVGDVSKVQVSGISCHLRSIEGGGLLYAVLEVIEGTVKVNGKSYEGNKHLLIKDGDELIFYGSAFIFLQSTLSSLTLNTVKDLELSTSIREAWEEELRKNIIHPDAIDVSFENFPYFISDTTENFMIASTRLHLDANFSEVRKLAPSTLSETQRLLLLGPAEFYQEALSKATAKHFEARLLIVDSSSLRGGKTIKEVGSSRRTGIDATVFHKPGTRVQYDGSYGPSLPNDGSLSRRGPRGGSIGTILFCFEDNKFAHHGVKFDKPYPGGNDLGGLCAVGHGLFCPGNMLTPLKDPHEGGDFQKKLINIFEFAFNESKSGPLIVFFKDIKKIVIGESQILQNKVECLPRSIVLIASCMKIDNDEKKTQASTNNGGSAFLAAKEKPSIPYFKGNDSSEFMKQINSLFPNELTIQLPKDQASISHWKQQLEHHIQTVNAQSNVAIIRSFLSKIGLDCPGLEALSIKDRTLTIEDVHKIIGWAIGYSEDSIKESKLVISSESINYGLGMLESIQSANRELADSLKAVITENEFEENLLAAVIPPTNIGITFEDVGALENVKENLKELVMLPLQRPELFTKGQLAKPCKGILLFGPPGTGKTMLAKAVATEAGANFINVSVSDITSKWVGDSEKYIKAIFSLANKIAPSVVFIDEVDSLLSKRGNNNMNEVHNKMKTEFFVHWDGLRTQEDNRVLVLAATNRPFDLDEAVIRRLPRRFMVSLPDATNREKILKVLLGKEKLSPDVDIKALASITNGYSGSDLKERDLALAQGKPLPRLRSSSDKRPLNMEDLLYAQKQVCASVMAESSTMDELLQWNDSFGGGGGRSGNDRHLSYYV